MWNQELYIKAMSFAAEAHAGQQVPGQNYSYLYHLTLVAAEAISVLFHEKVNDPDLLVQCSILHDTVEDTSVTINAIEENFGAGVAAGIAALTKDVGLPKSQAMEESIERIHAQPTEIWMVKMADRITNLQPPPPHWSRQRCDEYRKEALYILMALGEASPFLTERLALKISNYESYC